MQLGAVELGLIQPRHVRLERRLLMIEDNSRMTMRALHGDITTLKVDVIVNAANSSLLGGGGVDGAIHRAAGSELLAECRMLNGCKTGEAKITRGYRLPSGHVIHTVGPVWSGGKSREPELLVACYRNSLALADQHRLTSIAFPSISTGVYGYPKEPAARIAVATVRDYLRGESTLREIFFCCFSQEDFALYLRVLGEP
jgi:O-acetyl-ADP-ribose deacetylase